MSTKIIFIQHNIKNNFKYAQYLISVFPVIFSNQNFEHFFSNFKKKYFKQFFLQFFPPQVPISCKFLTVIPTKANWSSFSVR